MGEKYVDFAVEILTARTEAFEKAKDSICKNCKNGANFNGEFYDCKEKSFLQVEYEKNDDLFTAKIIKCNKFEDKNAKERKRF